MAKLPHIAPQILIVISLGGPNDTIKAYTLSHIHSLKQSWYVVGNLLVNTIEWNAIFLCKYRNHDMK